MPSHLFNFLTLFFTNPSPDSHIQLSPPILLAGVLCFVAASISSAGGIGGGGLFIPILKIVAGLDLKTSTSFSAFMVTGGSVANVVSNMFIKTQTGGKKTLIDYDIALLSEPCMLLGVSIGVICNVMLPEWLIIVSFAVFLAWSTTKTCKSGMSFWRLESQRQGMSQNAQIQDPLLSKQIPKFKLEIPCFKLGILLIIWLSFFLLYVFRGNNQGQGIIHIEACGVGYWIISAIQIPLAVIFTASIVYCGGGFQKMAFDEENMVGGVKTKSQGREMLMFPLMALLAGGLGGVFGIGGGMLISPLLLQAGIPPEVSAGTCSFMVFFSSTMSAVQYLLLGMEHAPSATIFAVICFGGSLIGLIVVQRAVEKHGRASVIVFSVGIVMALSTILITCNGAFDVWRDYTSGEYMGFKKPC